MIVEIFKVLISSSRLELARALRQRAVQLCRFSMIALGAIGALLFVAVELILFAVFIGNLLEGQTGSWNIKSTINAEQQNAKLQSLIRAEFEATDDYQLGFQRAVQAVMKETGLSGVEARWLVMRLRGDGSAKSPN